MNWRFISVQLLILAVGNLTGLGVPVLAGLWALTTGLSPCTAFPAYPQQRSWDRSRIPCWIERRSVRDPQVPEEGWSHKTRSYSEHPKSSTDTDNSSTKRRGFHVLACHLNSERDLNYLEILFFFPQSFCFLGRKFLSDRVNTTICASSCVCVTIMALHPK